MKVLDFYRTNLEKEIAMRVLALIGLVGIGSLISCGPMESKDTKRIDFVAGTCGVLTLDTNHNIVGEIKPTGFGQDPTCIMRGNSKTKAAFAGWCGEPSECNVPVLFRGRQGNSLREARGNIISIDKTGDTVQVQWVTGDAVSAESPGGEGVLIRQDKLW